MRRAQWGASGLLWLLGAVAVPRAATAQTRAVAVAAAAPETRTKAQLEAQQHFQRAKDLYQAGSYREAIAALEAARDLDAKAKDLVFNLGIVHEKLGHYDEAIAYFRQYLEMEGVTAPERAKTESIIKRVEGAKREAPADAKPPEPVEQTPPPATPPPARPESLPRGRIDMLTVNAGAVAVIGLGVGTAFGVLALSNQPSKGFVTGRDGTYDDLRSRSETAHTQAVIADIGFGVGLVALAVTGYLYFGRTKEPAKRVWMPSVAPATAAGGRLAGATLGLGGSFE